MRKLKLSLSLILMVMVFGCSNQELLEDTQPTREAIESLPGTPPEQLPVPVNMTISIVYPRGFDRVAFRADYGPGMGMTMYSTCPSDPSKELWLIDYKTESEFATMLFGLFHAVEIPGTQSNGTGGYQSYVKYNSSSSGSNTTTGIDNFILIPVEIFYNGSCD